MRERVLRLTCVLVIIVYNHGIGMKNTYDFDRKNFSHKI